MITRCAPADASGDGVVVRYAHRDRGIEAEGDDPSASETPTSNSRLVVSRWSRTAPAQRPRRPARPADSRSRPRLCPHRSRRPRPSGRTSSLSPTGASRRLMPSPSRSRSSITFMTPSSLDTSPISEVLYAQTVTTTRSRGVSLTTTGGGLTGVTRCLDRFETKNLERCAGATAVAQVTPSQNRRGLQQPIWVVDGYQY